MKKLRSALADRLGDLALLAGAVTVSIGAGMIYFPAGVIVAGVLLMIGAVLSGGGDA